MDNIKEFPKVASSVCTDYDADKIKDILREHFNHLGIDSETFKGKRVAIKPNLVAAKSPENAVTTHPAVIEAVYLLLREMGAHDIILAESPGGPYSAIALSHIYKVTEITNVADRTGMQINRDYSYTKINFAEGKKLKSFDVITPIAECDVIVNICKLKTHSLTGLSCAVKNLFGVIPGTLKFEMHSAYSTIPDFSQMLVDLNLTLARDKEIISICDGILSMEGNGPTHGTPVKTDIVLSSRSTFALDVAAESLIGNTGETLYLDYGCEQLGISRNLPDGVISLNPIENGLKRPDSKAGSLLRNLPNYFGGKLARFFEPKPMINHKKCVGCGKCEGYCPEHTITIIKKKGKSKAKINATNCIRCYCCQELCPFGAVDTVKNPLLRFIH